MSDILSIIGSLIFGYLLGSIPFGLLITRIAGQGDIRSIGSGNIGATNVLRTGHKGLAAATLLGDAAKGFFAVFITLYISDFAAYCAGLGAFLGHLFPLWLKFKGGKGIATYIGILLAFSFPATLVFAVVWLLTAYLKRISSLAALAATLVVPIFLAFTSPLSLAILFFILSALAWWKHSENIKRLRAGTESKIGNKG